MSPNGGELYPKETKLQAVITALFHWQVLLSTTCYSRLLVCHVTQILSACLSMT